MRAHLVIGLASALAACTAHHAQLARAQAAFDASELERADVTLRDLEPNRRVLDADDRARYDYLRGMTELRLGDRAAARHWLGIAKANDAPALPAEWRARLDESLKELDTAVYDDGYGTLITTSKK